MTPKLPSPSFLPQPPVGKIPAPPLYPRHRDGVLKIARDWYTPSRVRVDGHAIAQLPVGTITPPPAGETNLESSLAVPLHEASEFAIAMGAINHRFWSLDEAGRFVRYAHDGQVGAWAMSQAFEKAWADANSPIRCARDRGLALTPAAIRQVFGDIPDLQGRAEILNEILLSDRLAHLARESERMASAGERFSTGFAAALADAFPQGYADEVLKKAQLATSAIWRSAVGRGYESPEPELTAFADYQIPRVLCAMGLLEYAPDLVETIAAYRPIAPDSLDERALRAASILAIEQLAMAQGVGVADVDYWVWLQRKVPTDPFHLTLTTAY